LALPILGVGIFAISEKIQQTDWKYASFKLFGTKSRIADFSPQSENRKTISWEMAEDHLETAKQSESSSPITSDTPIIDNSIKTNSKPDTEFSGAEKEYKYDIIVGAFSVNSNALNYVKTLKSKGYNAYLAGKGKNGLLMVAVNGSDNQNQAIQTLDSVKIELNPQAWINQN